MKKPQKKTAKTKTRSRKTQTRRKNPIDYKLLSDLNIHAPLGLPSGSKEAFQLGSIIGTVYFIEVFEGIKFKGNLEEFYLRKIKNIANTYKNTDFTKLPVLPSDAFMLGLIYALTDGVINLSGRDAKSRNMRRRALELARNSPLYRMYADDRIPSPPQGKLSQLKAYFGLRP